MSLYGKDAHKKVARSVGYALTLGTPNAWRKLSLILLARLSKRERAGLTYAALMSLDEDTAYEVATLALFGVAKAERMQ